MKTVLLIFLLSAVLANPCNAGMVGGIDGGVMTYSDRNSDCSYAVWAGPVWVWEGILGVGLVVYGTPEDWDRSNTALVGEVCLGGLVGLPRWCPVGVGAYLPFSAYDARVGWLVDVIRWEW